MDIGIDPTTGSSGPLPASGKSWTVEDVAQLQELLGRAQPLATNGHQANVYQGNGQQANGHQTAVYTAGGHHSAVAADDTTPGLRTVSGRYRGSIGTLSLELRVDVDGIRPTRRISGDFFRTTGGTTSYAGSFVVHTPVIQVSATEVTIDGTGTFSMQISAPRLRVVIARTATFMAAAPATVQFMTSQGVIGATFSCTFESPFFRRVEFERDFVQSVTPFTQYDTALLPSGGPGRVLSVAAAYAEAGVEMVDTGDSLAIPDSGVGVDGVWSNAELHASMVDHFSVWKDEPGRQN